MIISKKKKTKTKTKKTTTKKLFMMFWFSFTTKTPTRTQKTYRIFGMKTKYELRLNQKLLELFPLFQGYLKLPNPTEIFSKVHVCEASKKSDNASEFVYKTHALLPCSSYCQWNNFLFLILHLKTPLYTEVCIMVFDM